MNQSEQAKKHFERLAQKSKIAEQNLYKMIEIIKKRYKTDIPKNSIGIIEDNPDTDEIEEIEHLDNDDNIDTNIDDENDPSILDDD